MVTRRRTEQESEPVSGALLRQIREVASPLQNVSDLDPLVARIGNAHHVFIGEASHGTADYYNWRIALTKRLVTEKGFQFIAVEGDWPDCYQLNRYAKRYPDCAPSAEAALRTGFRRWPTWMWANGEVLEFIEWLRRGNDSLPDERKTGFYGLDVYSLWDSLEVLAGFLRQRHIDAWTAFHEVVACFEPCGADLQRYAVMAGFQGKDCESEAVNLLAEVCAHKDGGFPEDGREGAFQSVQNALVVKNAEAYYRAMVQSGPDSWNIRDRHMMATLERLVDLHGPAAKSIVWEHNTHIGDARYTDMAEVGEVNIGQLARERWGEDDVVLVGFSCYEGSVIAGNAWDAPMQVMPVPQGRTDSWEDALHRSGGENKLLIFDKSKGNMDLFMLRGHRAIGVVYHPDFEQYGNYVPTILPKRYDALLHLDRTTALHPLKITPARTHEPPETYPTAV